MTAQAPDHLQLDDRRWDITAVDGEGLFDPADLGVEAVSSSSANWRGFSCGYAVADGRFLLEDLWLSSLSRIGGEQVTMLTDLLGVRPASETSWGDLVFEGVNHPVAFSGRLLVADGFIDELYVHMGFQPAWRYERVRELHVDQGRVTVDVDRSQEIAAAREQMIAGERAGQADDRVAWIEQSFSRDWKRSLPE